MKEKRKKRRQLCFLALFSLLCLYFFLLPLFVCLSTRDRIVKPCEISAESRFVAIVPGCGIKNGKPSAMLTERMDAALVLFREGKVDTILLSGYRENDDYDEPACMKRYFTEAGVPENCLLLDPCGVSTSETVRRAKKQYGIESAVIVTQRYHLYRALFLADSCGMEAVGADAAKTRFPGQSCRNVREFLAIHKDFLKTLFSFGK